ncbi:dihydrodipicolinate synthase family protein [Luteimicrobium album]|uniref:Dihydrodipicolinate synthase family protein n=1 Tax=Luteimicrobium album TaxID=1054550 RepID=A0ABQ6I468_9MICO|nr:dihydrodipicolinate synthase family protein [Luteimicrobium album]GMA25295.1 dihydrodipicolinate synthase family protein [Luteimicrobium album]
MTTRAPRRAVPGDPFTGLLAYPITPLDDDGTPALAVLGELVGAAVGAGVDGVVVLASSGDGRAFDASERDRVVRAAREAAGSVPLHVAVSAPATSQVVEHARAAERAGADGLLLAPFSYAPLVDAEVAALVRAVGAASALPLCFYNKPVQTGYDLTPGLLAELAATTTLRGVKDPATLPTRSGTRVEALQDVLGSDRAGVATSVAVGLSGDVALTSDASVSDAWHTGLAALAPAEYVTLRRSRVDGDVGPTPQGTWLHDLAVALGTVRPVAGLHALATLLGVPTGPPRGPWLPVPPDGVSRLRDVVARRP